jgi:hypothetical protein
LDHPQVSTVHVEHWQVAHRRFIGIAGAQCLGQQVFDQIIARS